MTFLNAADMTARISLCTVALLGRDIKHRLSLKSLSSHDSRDTTGSRVVTQIKDSLSLCDARLHAYDSGLRYAAELSGIFQLLPERSRLAVSR